MASRILFGFGVVCSTPRQRFAILPLALEGLLTYMSIHVSIEDAVARGLLFLVEPTMQSEPMNRALYASPTVHRLTTGPWADEAEQYRSGQLRADFDRFVEGRLVPVALDSPHKKPKDTYLSRMDPAEDEVWQIRSRAPRPAIRVFGRFAYRDCFVALTWRFRKELEGRESRAHKKEIRNCLAAWRRTFPSYNAFTGESVNDYISEKALSV